MDIGGGGAEVVVLEYVTKRDTAGTESMIKDLENIKGASGGAQAALSALGPEADIAVKAFEALTAAWIAGVGALAMMVKGVIDAGSKLSDLSGKTDIGVKKLQEWAFAGKDVGVSAETIATAAVRMSEKIAEGSNKTREAIAGIGLSFEKLQGMSTEEQFKAIATAIQNMGNAGEQAAAAQALGFGRTGEMLKFIRSDFEAAGMAAQDAGAVMSQETVAAADALGDSVGRLGEAWAGLQAALVEEIVKSGELLALFDAMVNALGTTTRFVRENEEAFRALFDVLAAPQLNAALDLFTELAGRIDQARVAADLLKVALGDVGEDPKIRKSTTLFDPGSGPRLAVEQDLAAALKMLEKGLTEDYKKQSAERVAEAKRANAEMLADKRAAIALELRQKNLMDDAKRGFEKGDAKRDEAEAIKAVLGPLQQELRFKQLIEKTDREATAASISGAEVERALMRQKLLDMASAIKSGESLKTQQLAMLETMRKQVGEDAYAKIKASIEGTTTSTKELARESRDLKRAVGEIGDVFLQLGEQTGGVWGGIATGIGYAAKAFENFNSKASTAQKVAQAAMGALQIYNDNKEKLNAGAATANGAEQGAAAGAAFGAWGVVIGAALGGIVGFFSGDKFRTMAKNAGKTLGFEISEELAKAIAKTMRDLKVDVKTASLLNLDKAMVENSVLRPVTAFKGQVAELMVGIAAGVIPAKEGLKQLGLAFGEVGKAAAAGDKEAQRMLAQMMQAARATGIKVPEIAAAVKAALDVATAGMKDFAENFTITSPEDAKAEAMIFASVFWAKVKEEGIVAAGQAMMPAWKAMQQAMKDAGIDPEVTASILAPMQGIMDILSDEKLAKIVAGLDGATRAVKGLSDAGYMTQGAFDALGQVAQSTYAQLIAGGADSVAALNALAPTLAQIISDHERYGTVIDDATQKLIDEAKAAGIAFPTDPLLQVIDLLAELVTVMGGTLPESVKRAADAYRELQRAANDAADAQRRSNEGPDGGGGSEPPPPPGGNPDGFAWGGTVHAPESGGMALVHGTEHILRPEQLQGYMAAAMKMAGNSGSGNSGPVTVVIQLDGQKLGQAVVDMRRRGSAAFGR